MVSNVATNALGVKVNYKSEIANMMHGFGDNPNPLAETVILVENFVLHQLKSMLQRASSNSMLRLSNVISNYDIIYQMNKNKHIMKRLLEHQIKLEQVDINRPGMFLAPIVNGVLMDDDKEPIIRYPRSHIDIIEDLDEMNQVTLMKYDFIDTMRKVRANIITEAMSYEKYLVYHEARRSSFRIQSGRNIKLESWINPGKVFEITDCALEVLAFRAYETVAEIVDAVFLIRLDAKKNRGAPFGNVEGENLNNVVNIHSDVAALAAITVAEVREVLQRYYEPGTGMKEQFYQSLESASNYVAI